MEICRRKNQIEISELDPFLPNCFAKFPRAPDGRRRLAAEQRIFSPRVNEKETDCAPSGKCMSNLNCAVSFRPRPRRGADLEQLMERKKSRKRTLRIPTNCRRMVVRAKTGRLVIATKNNFTELET